MIKLTPIEQKFWDAIGPMISDLYQHPVCGLTIDQLHERFGIDYAAQMIIAPQVVWDRFRTDFTILARKQRKDGGGIFQLVIECDGHEFHSQTKEQAKKDRSRDRHFLVRGVPVMRFTGSELWNDAPGCVLEVMNCLMHHRVFVRNDFDSPSFVATTICDLMEDPSVTGSIEHLAMVVGGVADADGVARASPEFIRQETGITPDELPQVSIDLAPYLTMQTIDTFGRVVFRFRRREWART